MELKNNSEILVSVIMCVFNTEKEFLYAAVNSILKQTHTNFELIIVDDCSESLFYNDDIFKDKRIKILKNNINCGPSFCRNLALKLSKGKYVAVMDSDDISVSTRLEDQVNFLESHSDYAACGTWFQFIGKKTHEVKRIIDDFEYFRCCLLFDNAPTILNSSVMIRKDVMTNNNLFWDEEFRIGEDYYLWVKLCELGLITNLKKILVKYRVHDNQTTNDDIRKKIKNNCWKIRDYQLRKIGLECPENILDLLVVKKVTEKKQIVSAYNLLMDIINSNEKSKYFNCEKLRLRCKNHIVDLLKTIKNPFLLLYFCFKKGFRKMAIQIFLLKLRNFFTLSFLRGKIHGNKTN